MANRFARSAKSKSLVKIKNRVNANFILLDAARMLDFMAVAREMNPAHVCLYQGEAEETMSETAPYLFTYKSKSEFAQWLAQYGWGNSWGVFIQASVDIELLRRHFRKYIMVQMWDGKQVYFRFYDPRVLRVFLPTCSDGQLREFFGPVAQFLVEDDDKEKVVMFSLKVQGNMLLNVMTTNISRTKAVAENP